jgi:hypothetical protein
MTDRDEWLDEAVTELKKPVPEDAQAKARIMAAVRAVAQESSRAGHEPRTVVSPHRRCFRNVRIARIPLYGAAGIVAVAAVILVLLVTRPAPDQPPAREMSPAVPRLSGPMVEEPAAQTPAREPADLLAQAPANEQAHPEEAPSLGEIGQAPAMASQLPVPVESGRPDPRLAARLDGATATSVAALIDSARAQDLPEEPLVLKALEGAAKGASGEGIVTAVGGLLTRLRTARAVLGREAGETELSAASAALFAGVDTSMIGQLRRAASAPRAGAAAGAGRAGETQPATLAVQLVVLADIIGGGVPREAAASLITALAQRGTPDRVMLALRDEIGRAARAGEPPADAATQWLQQNLPGWPSRAKEETPAEPSPRR